VRWAEPARLPPAQLPVSSPSAASVASTAESTLGWVRYGSVATPPSQQAMDRGGGGGGGEELAADPSARVKRHWSVSY